MSFSISVYPKLRLNVKEIGVYVHKNGKRGAVGHKMHFAA